jgi:outer membrane protein TolC
MKIAFAGTVCSLLFCFPVVAQQTPQSARQQNLSRQSANEQAAPAGGTLSLAEVVKLALAHSPDLMLARVRYAMQKNTARLDRASFLPNLYTGSGIAYTNGFPQTPSGSPPPVFEMSYNESIFDKQQSGQVHFDDEVAKNKQIDYQHARETVIVTAASAYLELADVQRSLQLLQSERDSAQQILDLTQQREAAGLELPVALTQSQLQAARIAQRIVMLEDREQVLTEQLRDMTGLSPDQPLRASPDETLASEPREPASNLVTDVVDHDAGLKEAENFRIARQDQLRGAKGSYWPTFGLIGQYSVLGKFNNYQEYFTHFQRNNVTVGVQITIPIFASKTSANVALAKSAFDEANAELAVAKQAVQQGAEQQIHALHEADAAREVARLDLQLAQQQLQDDEGLFNQGRMRLGDLEQARVLENDKWLAFLDANLFRERAQLNLLQATGQLAKMFPQ